MKKILCFGDSNTYGYNPVDGSRYDKNTRWTGVLSKLLQDKAEIIEAGCNNRTGFVNNPQGIKYTGFLALPEYLELNPDIVILAIGANDVQKFYNIELIEIERGIKNLISIVKNRLNNAKIILLVPLRLTEDVLSGGFSFQFDEKSIEKSLHFPSIYKKAAKETGTFCINLNDEACVSKADGLHYSPECHQLIARRVFEFIFADFKNSSNLSA